MNDLRKWADIICKSDHQNNCRLIKRGDDLYLSLLINGYESRTFLVNKEILRMLHEKIGRLIEAGRI